MRGKRSKAVRLGELPATDKKRRPERRVVEFGVTAGRVRSAVATKLTSSGNE
jgi:hypothetical protein